MSVTLVVTLANLYIVITIFLGIVGLLVQEKLGGGPTSSLSFEVGI